MNSRLGDSTITVDNFRPNIVVDGPNLEPHSEEDWEWIKINDVVFRNVKHCSNCSTGSNIEHLQSDDKSKSVNKLEGWVLVEYFK